MPSLTANMYNLIFKLMPQDQPGQAHDYEAERKRNDRTPHRPPKGVTVTQTELGGQQAERIEKPGNEKGWIFYIHGGGFTVGSARKRRNICQYIAAKHGYNCVSVGYRLARKTNGRPRSRIVLPPGRILWGRGTLPKILS